MRRFFLKFSFFTVLFIGGYFFLIERLSRQSIDLLYPKFTQQAGGLVLGLSRAGEDIDPATIEGIVPPDYLAKPLINFALYKFESPYGHVYLEGIKKKLGDSRPSGLFILSVNPGSFSAPKGFSDKAILELDQKMMMSRLTNITTYPNYEYFIRCYQPPLYTALYNSPFPNQIAHPNGWIESFLETPSFTMSKANMEDYKTFNKREYRRISSEEEISDYRIRSFKLIIQYLKKRGEVFIVNLPADEDILALEKSFWPNLKQEIGKIALDFQVPFFDYTEEHDNYTYYDGSHMESESARRFSRVLGADIRNSITNSIVIP